MTETLKLPFYARATLILVGALALLYIFYIGEPVIVPLIFALFLSILINPIVNFFERKRVPHLIAIALALIIVLVALAGLVFFISMQASVFNHTYPRLKEKFALLNTQVITWFSSEFNMDESVIVNWIKNTKTDGAKSLMGNLGHTLMSVGNTLVAMVLVPVYIFLILFYKPLLLEFVRKLFKVEYHKEVVEVLNSVNDIIYGYLRGLIIEGLIVATLNSLALLALGIEDAILLGVTGAILNVIPYIGGIIAFALPMIVALVTKSFLSCMLVLLLYSVIQFIDNHYLIPYIVASKVKINALICIVVVLIGNLIWGIPGMFLSIPITALLKVIFDHIEALKPFGFLLGDDIPSIIRLPFPKKRK